MHWKQVCVIAQTFAAAKGGSAILRFPIVTMYGPDDIDPYKRPLRLPLENATSTTRSFEHNSEHTSEHNSEHPIDPSPLTHLFNPSKLSIFPKFPDFSRDYAWFIRVTGTNHRPPIYFPPVSTQSDLKYTLEQAWDTDSSGTAVGGWRPVYLKSLDEIRSYRLPM